MSDYEDEREIDRLSKLVERLGLENDERVDQLNAALERVGRLEGARALAKEALAATRGATTSGTVAARLWHELNAVVSAIDAALAAQPAPEKPAEPGNIYNRSHPSPLQVESEKLAELPELTAEEKRACDAFDIKRVTGKPAQPAGGGE